MGRGHKIPLPPYTHQGHVTPLSALEFFPSLKPPWCFPCCHWFLQMAFFHWLLLHWVFSFGDFFLPLSGTGSAKAQSCLSLCQLLPAKKGGAFQSLACRQCHDVLGHLLHHLIACFSPISRPFIFSTQALERKGRKIKALQKKSSIIAWHHKGEIG